jgi:hypothetical protein
MYSKVLFIFLIFPIALFAQEEVPEKRVIKKKPASKQRILVNLNADNWIQTASYYNINPYNSRGVDIQILYDYVIKKSQFSLALGGGFNSNNIHSDAFPRTYALEGGGSYTKMDTTYFSGTDIRTNKISLNYIDIPFEVRWRSKQGLKIKKRWAVSVGFKIGFLVQSHTKTKTAQDVILNGSNLGNKYKTYDIENLNVVKYGVTVRVGFANAYLLGYYGISPVFKKGAGTPAHVLSVGIGYSPF